MPYEERTLKLPPTGEDGKWETHHIDIPIPENSRYRNTSASYNCPVHGLENVEERGDGHWFKFISATLDKDRYVVRCECSYQVHDRGSQVTFKVEYDN